MNDDQIKTVYIVGRPNVGKSSLFNKLSGNDVALTSPTAGSTLDNKTAWTSLKGIRYKLVDTAGYMDRHAMSEYAFSQKIAHASFEHAAIILFVVDNQTGLTSLDYDLAKIVRKQENVWLVVNKFDHAEDVINDDVSRLGFSDIIPISCKTGYQFAELQKTLYQYLHATNTEDIVETEQRIRVGIIGKPNAGKSSLVNALIGSHQRIVSDIPGTTRDTSEIPFKIANNIYWLTDTAGIRRKKKINDTIEKDAISLSVKTIKQCDIIIFLVRADFGLTDQDIKLLELCKKGNQGLIITLSQIDRDDSKENIDELEYQINRLLPHVKPLRLSIYKAKSMAHLKNAISDCQQSIEQTLQTSQLTKILMDLSAVQPPPRTSVSRIKCRFAHPGSKPRSIMIKGKQVESLPRSYKTYLYNGFMQRLGFIYTNISLTFQNDNNPYDS